MLVIGHLERAGALVQAVQAAGYGETGPVGGLQGEAGPKLLLHSHGAQITHLLDFTIDYHLQGL